MSSRHLINQLAELKTRRHAPVVWRLETRDSLLAKIVAPTQPSYSFRERVWLGLNNFRQAIAPVRLAPAVLTLFLVIGGAVPFTNAMNQSLPDSYLYTLKRVSERIELSLHTSGPSQGIFYLKLAERRLAEAAAVTNEAAKADLLRDYNIDLSFAQSNLQAANGNKDVAAAFDLASQKLLTRLYQLKISAAIEPAYNASLSLTEKLSSRTLALLVVSSKVSPEVTAPLTERLNQQIAKVQAKLDGVDGKLVKLPTNKPAPRVVLESKEIIVPVKEASRQAKQTLDEAKELVQNKEFTLALQKLEESEDIAAKSEAAVLRVSGDDTADKADKTDKTGKVEGASTENIDKTDTVLPEAKPEVKPETKPEELKGQKVELR